jgi:hypothetical protein
MISQGCWHSVEALEGLHWYRRRGYYEHVVRNEKALDRIRVYIANNPARWADDPERTSRERFLPKQGGFETRPYKSPDLCVRRAAALSPSAQALFDHLAAPA